jgi:anti-anti-sigma factor
LSHQPAIDRQLLMSLRGGTPVSGSQQLPLLRISVERSGDSAVLRLDGELDCATAADVQSALDALLMGTERPARILVDAEKLAFIDVSGLDPLIRAGQRMPGTGAFQLRNPGRQVVRIIRLLDLSDLFGLDR